LREGTKFRRHLTSAAPLALGSLLTLSGGVPKSLGLLGDALAAEASAFTFAQRNHQSRVAQDFVVDRLNALAQEGAVKANVTP